MSGEGRRNTLAFLIAGAIVLVVIAFALLPAVLLPVEKGTLASSVGAEGFMGKGCDRAPGEGNFTCVVPKEGYSSSAHYDVHVDWTGCWEATTPTRVEHSDHGCVHLWDY